MGPPIRKQLRKEFAEKGYDKLNTKDYMTTLEGLIKEERKKRTRAEARVRSISPQKN